MACAFVFVIAHKKHTRLDKCADYYEPSRHVSNQSQHQTAHQFITSEVKFG